jgi:hypothetical protein
MSVQSRACAPVERGAAALTAPVGPGEDQRACCGVQVARLVADDGVHTRSHAAVTLTTAGAVCIVSDKSRGVGEEGARTV